MKEEKITFGKFILKEREILSLTIEEVANKLQVNPATIYHWEHDKKKPNKKHVRAIADLYCVSTKKLVELLGK